MLFVLSGKGIKSSHIQDLCIKCSKRMPFHQSITPWFGFHCWFLHPFRRRTWVSQQLREQYQRWVDWSRQRQWQRVRCMTCCWVVSAPSSVLWGARSHGPPRVSVALSRIAHCPSHSPSLPCSRSSSHPSSRSLSSASPTGAVPVFCGMAMKGGSRGSKYLLFSVNSLTFICTFDVRDYLLYQSMVQWNVMAIWMQCSEASLNTRG